VKQEDLKKLLIEAASPTCSPVRQSQIQILLSEASAAMNEHGVVVRDDGRLAGMLFLLEDLYVETLKHRPELLPTFFPVFAIVCGDRDEECVVADVDWNLVN